MMFFLKKYQQDVYGHGTLVGSQYMAAAVFIPPPFFCIMTHVITYLGSARAQRMSCFSAVSSRDETLGWAHLKGRFSDCNSFRQESTIELIHMLTFSWLYLCATSHGGII